jgi:hypothetical protein
MSTKSDNVSPIVAKPLRRKAYGNISHLPGSRLGPGDHHCSEGQAKILLEKTRDRHDHIIVCEKLDGSNVAVCRIGGEIIPLSRKGYLAASSQYPQHRAFTRWVYQHAPLFDALLNEGEWVSGEWLGLAHGTIYDLRNRPPFAAFDLWRNGERVIYDEFLFLCECAGVETVPVLCRGEPCSVNAALALLGDHGRYGAVDLAEGCVWRCERKGKCEFLAKFVRADKEDGKYLPAVSGKSEVWLWDVDRMRAKNLMRR